MSPKSLILRPNCVRLMAWSADMRMTALHVPVNAATMPKRPLLRMFIATLKPPPTSPSTFSTGTLQFSKYTSAVLLHLMPIFFSGGPCDTPPKPRSTMNAVTLSFISPVFSSFTSVCANTVNTSAMPPFEIQILEPFRMKCFPSSLRVARVRIEFASEPDVGSVSTKAANFLPVARSGRYLDFCSSLPAIKMPLNPMDWCAPRKMPTPRSCAPTISTMRAYCVLVSPTPPSSSGTCRPNAPSSAKPLVTWSGTFSSRSFCFASFTSSKKRDTGSTNMPSVSRCSAVSTSGKGNTDSALRSPQKMPRTKDSL
mmetsp:Transcript_22274/g.71709  ORF Transcript_22274/g.71709 Transcript_22274/m.71709 type:complete len:311 (+) Transcript_22274:863-1795(+)